MERTLRLQTTVLPGHRIELSVPDLPEGRKVEVTIRLSEAPIPRSYGILDFLDSLPTGPRSYPTWEEFDRRFQEERNSWDR